MDTNKTYVLIDFATGVISSVRATSPSRACHLVAPAEVDPFEEVDFFMDRGFTVYEAPAGWTHEDGTEGMAPVGLFQAWTQGGVAV